MSHDSLSSKTVHSTDTLPSFDEVYAAHGERLLHLLFRFTNNEEAARDLLQDVFVKVYQNLSSFRKEAELSTWLHRIAVNHALNYLKRERRTFWFNVLDESVGTLLKQERIELPRWQPGESPQPDHLLESKEQQEIVDRAVASLPLKYRAAYLLYRDGELSTEEIAKALDISTSAVESRIHRAKKLLIEKLKPLLSG